MHRKRIVMKEKRDILRRALLAWMLLMVFLMPLVVRTLHVCHSCSAMPICSSQTVIFQTPAHDAASCPICQFSFLSFDKASILVFQALATLFISALILFLAVGYRQHRGAVVSLRAPPVL